MGLLIPDRIGDLERNLLTAQLAIIAYDIQPFGAGPSEPKSVGVTFAFAHRDGNGNDILLDVIPPNVRRSPFLRFSDN